MHVIHGKYLLTTTIKACQETIKDLITAQGERGWGVGGGCPLTIVVSIIAWTQYAHTLTLIDRLFI